jgi:hypothetical protein
MYTSFRARQAVASLAAAWLAVVSLVATARGSGVSSPRTRRLRPLLPAAGRPLLPGAAERWLALAEPLPTPSRCQMLTELPPLRSPAEVLPTPSRCKILAELLPTLARVRPTPTSAAALRSHSGASSSELRDTSTRAAPLALLVALLQPGVAESGHEVNEPPEGGQKRNECVAFSDAGSAGVAALPVERSAAAGSGAANSGAAGSTASAGSPLVR